ncbi:MAG: tail fiber domain-containing protein [Micrococcales bacterium]|nr:tail fiber domain-containing protein [Micrococcales bacterium]
MSVGGTASNQRLNVIAPVFTTSASGGMRIGDSGSNYYTDYLVKTDSSANPYVQWSFASHTLAQYWYGGGNNYWAWYANNTEQMRLTSTGLGIGTSLPAAKLQVDLTGTSSAISTVTSFGSAGVVSLGKIPNNNEGVYLGIGTTQTGTQGGIAAGIGFYREASGWNSALVFYTNGTTDGVTTNRISERMRLDSSGNLGLGVTPSAWGLSGTNKAIQLLGASVFSLNTQNAVFGQNVYHNGTNFLYQTTDVASVYRQSAAQHQWFTAPSGTAGNAITFTQAMTLDASGNLLVGTTSSSSSSGTGFKVLSPSANHWDPAVVTSGNSSGLSCWDIYSTATSSYRFYVTTTGVINAVNTTISAISDIRFKENIQDLDVGLNAVMALKPRKFDWKEGKGKNIKGDRGFIAQEFEQVFPDLIDEWKDPAPEGEEPYKSVRQDLIPVLVKAVQELKAQNDELRARVAALEGA